MMNEELPTVFSVCDLSYFHRFAKSFVKSSVDNGHSVKLVVIQSEKFFDIKAFSDLKASLEALGSVVIQLMSHELFSGLKSQFDVVDVKSFYANMRFILMHEYLMGVSRSRKNRDIVILDIDSIVNKPILPIEEDVGLFFREPENYANDYEKSGMRIAAGIVYVRNTEGGQKFARKCLDQIFSIPIRWFSDQVALYNNFLTFENVIRFKAYQRCDLDWDFNDDSIIWTAKGDRKNNDLKYLHRKEQLENDF